MRRLGGSRPDRTNEGGCHHRRLAEGLQGPIFHSVTAPDVTLTYEADIADIATVDANGILTAKAPGDTAVTLTLEAETMKINVHTVQMVEEYELNHETLEGLERTTAALGVGERNRLLHNIDEDCPHLQLSATPRLNPSSLME